MNFESFILAERARNCRFTTAVKHPTYGIFPLGKNESIHRHILNRVIKDFALENDNDLICGFYEFETEVFYEREEFSKRFEYWETIHLRRENLIATPFVSSNATIDEKRQCEYWVSAQGKDNFKGD